MKNAAGYLYIAQMDIDEAHEARFNEVYNTEHVPLILAVPGVLACYRYKTVRSNDTSYPRYTAIYVVESPDVVASPEWRKAADTGSWAPEIRPFTTNKRLTVLENIEVKK